MTITIVRPIDSGIQTISYLNPEVLPQLPSILLKEMMHAHASGFIPNIELTKSYKLKDLSLKMEVAEIRARSHEIDISFAQLYAECFGNFMTVLDQYKLKRGMKGHKMYASVRYRMKTAVLTEE